MYIHEYQAKQILNQYGVPILRGVIILHDKEVYDIIQNFNADLYVIKAQIHSGGRLKAGGIKLAYTKVEARDYAYHMLGKTLFTHQTGIHGKIIKRVYIESGCCIRKEYYLGITVNRVNSTITLMASQKGGVNIEDIIENSANTIVEVSVNPIIGLQTFHCRAIAYGLGVVGDQVKKIINIVTCLYNAFVSTDAAQIEINPLAIDSSGNFFALDVKMSFDQNALFRHPAIVALRDDNEEDVLELKARAYNLNYVRMYDGNIGCIVNGAGLAMCTMDIIQLYGAKPANFLDIGGGVNIRQVIEAFKIILSDKTVEGILVNIFGGIVHCDLIATGLVNAVQALHINMPLVVRLAGTNHVLGNKIISHSGLHIITAHDLGDAVAKIVNITSR